MHEKAVAAPATAPGTPNAAPGGGIRETVDLLSGQTAEPAFQSAQLRFQPLRPLSG